MVLNGDECIPQAQCPCHYHGKPYSEGMRIQQDCRTWYVYILYINRQHEASTGHKFGLLFAEIVLQQML